MAGLTLRILEGYLPVRDADLALAIKRDCQRQAELAHDRYVLLPSASGPARQSEGNVSRSHVFREPLRCAHGVRIPLPRSAALRWSAGGPNNRPLPLPIVHGRRGHFGEVRKAGQGPPRVPAGQPRCAVVAVVGFPVTAVTAVTVLAQGCGRRARWSAEGCIV